MGAPRRFHRRSVFDDAAQFVLEHAPARVMVVAPREASRVNGSGALPSRVQVAAS